MAQPLSAAPPLETPRYPVGKRTTIVLDAARADRLLGVDYWYPAAPSDDAAPARYEVIPGVGFDGAAALDAPAALPGGFPLLLWSPGRTGTRFAYSLLCEAIAARGVIVVSMDHPGDGMADWLLGTQVDDDTNDVQRIGDATAVLDAFCGDGPFSADVRAAVDNSRIIAGGHSYGGFTALAMAAGARGIAADERICGVAVAQAFTRRLSDSSLRRVAVPLLMVVSEHDETTPPATDGDRAWDLLDTTPAWRLDLEAAGHQASSDTGLYAELAPHVEQLPKVVRDLLAQSLADTFAPEFRPWRENVTLHVQAIGAFIESTVGDGVAGAAEFATLAAQPGVTLRRRG
jgi:pimeloyl-ACP methyl ester carboxylesterase